MFSLPFTHIASRHCSTILTMSPSGPCLPSTLKGKIKKNIILTKSPYFRYLICTRNVKPSILTRKVFLVVLYIFGLVLNIPNVFTFRPDLDKTANGSIWVLQETEFSKSQANYEYKFWIHCFLICILPLAIMIVLNVRIAICIRKSFSMIQNHLSGVSTRTKQVGLKLTLVCLLIHIS